MKMMSKSRRYSLKDVLFDLFNYTIIILFAISCLYPFYYIFLYSISDSVEAARGAVVLWPVKPDFSTYKQLLLSPDIAHAAFISISRTVIGTLISVLCSGYFAYLLTRQDLPFRKIIYRFTIFTMYVSAGLIPWYMLMMKLGLKNNFLLYVLPGAIQAFNIILVKTYIEQIPRSLEESAMLDGAGNFTLFFRIVFPVSLPIFATIAVFCAVSQWNTWQDNFYLVNNRNLMTLQFLLLKYMNSLIAIGMSQKASLMSVASRAKSISPISIQMTMAMITVLPVLLVYPIMQRYFIKGIMIGAIKG